ncbi:hypothetical protein AB0C11_04000 [Streptomyces sp. NPDC039016]|uniref:hypothetical protein n=1 Tax=Streptomyces sp. NPDC039016 TaxID=3154330 RepID=UPI0033DB7DEF
MSASSAGSTTAVISVMRPSVTVKTSRDSGVPSSFQAMTPGRPFQLQDGAEGVTDAIWEEANAHFTEEQIGVINLEIALTNFFNRINRTLKEPAGRTWG